ncbi:unnamed protein product [Caenorhabditis auriculariae]|uniref:Fibronectin type-III domain-containing protein n=1 Tax=Caenorhabditis auriculariae TaxID=2777116 RepID=A0A8S1HEH2_9PELO|nr:unnamed protein product [Caenorhabditis auriculariae]
MLTLLRRTKTSRETEKRLSAIILLLPDASRCVTPIPTLNHPGGVMCGPAILNSGLCRFSELTPGQFGLTKQLVLRLALPHVTLLLVSIIYAAFGGWMLTIIKYNDQTAQAPSILEQSKQMMVRRLLTLNRSELERGFVQFAEELFEVYNNEGLGRDAVVTSSHPFSNFTSNLFFAATTLTSIGYGTDAPVSPVGRIFCLVYLFFGIPLYLITIADLAKFCTEGMNRLYTEIIKYKFTVKRRYKRWKSGRNRRDSIRVGQVIIAGGEDESIFSSFPGILLAYIGFSSWIISWVEGWNATDGFYFVMMSVLTIGFGDMVPRNDVFTVPVLILVFVGLVLTTTCVDIVGAYYIDRLHFFGRRLDDDPLSWLKEVQQRRIEAMKKEAMRKLFETVTALHHIRLTAFKHLTENYEENMLQRAPPPPPRNLVASHSTADTVMLRWSAPVYVDEGKRYWYTLKYKPRTPQRRNNVVVVDFITKDRYLVTGLKSFTLYEFSMFTTTRYGQSTPIRAQEYTEPCTVPQSVRIDAISDETATISWRTPKVNNGPEKYVIQFTQEPAPQFTYWNRYRVGDSTRFTLTNLLPDTRYIICVSAEHNYGLAAMSKAMRFRTKTWWGDDDSQYLKIPGTSHRLSIASAISTLSALR